MCNPLRKITYLLVLCFYTGISFSTQIHLSKDDENHPNNRASLVERRHAGPWVDLTDPAYSSLHVAHRSAVVPFISEESLNTTKNNVTCYAPVAPRDQVQSLSSHEYATYRRLLPFFTFFKQRRSDLGDLREMKKKQLRNIYLDSDKSSKEYIAHTDSERELILQALQHDDVVDVALAFSALVVYDDLKPVCENAD